jgi:hypothetical protein
MKRFVAIAGFVSAVSSFALPSAAQPSIGGQSVTVLGCTRPAVERCVILDTNMPGVSFSLYSTSPVPAFGRAALVTGWVGGIIGFCPGTPMNVTSWHYVKARCPRPNR